MTSMGHPQEFIFKDSTKDINVVLFLILLTKYAE